MPQHPTYTLSGGNQYPAVSTAVPAQYPTIAVVDGQGNLVSNLGNGPADGTWISMTMNSGVVTADVNDPPQYMKDSRGIVHCRGKVTVTTTGIAFTFPVGFHPPAGTVLFHWAISPHASQVSPSGGLSFNSTGATANLGIIHYATTIPA